MPLGGRPYKPKLGATSYLYAAAPGDASFFSDGWIGPRRPQDAMRRTTDKRAHRLRIWPLQSGGSPLSVSTMASAVSITPTHFGNHAHQAAFLALLDHYATDPMGGGTGLSDYAKSHLVAQLARHPGFVGFIAWDDGGRAVGLINCFEGFSTFAAKPLLNIHDIVVLGGQRGQGIGQALLQAAEAAAQARGCCKLTLEVLSNNHRAVASYARFGFRPYALDPAAGQALFLEKKLQSA